MSELIIFCFAFLFMFLPAALIAGVLEQIESKRIEGGKRNVRKRNDCRRK